MLLGRKSNKNLASRPSFAPDCAQKSPPYPLRTSFVPKSVLLRSTFGPMERRKTGEGKTPSGMKNLYTPTPSQRHAQPSPHVGLPIRNAQPDAVADDKLAVILGIRGLEHHRLDGEQRSKLRNVPLIAAAHIEVVYGQRRAVGLHASPTVVAQEADALAGIGGHAVAQRHGAIRLLSTYHPRGIQMQMVPIRRQRALQPGYIGNAVGTYQPRTAPFRQAMHGRTATHVIKIQATNFPWVVI